MFVDVAKIKVCAGKGGDGAVSFHREKYVAAGGPDGGDGGNGGDIIFVVDDNLSTLIDFRYKRKYVAGNGDNGSTKNMKGKSGNDLVIKVPRGTLVKDADTGIVLADISTEKPIVIAKGGRGGWGNTHFATATRQIPRFAKNGLPGEEYEISLELKLLADVGLVGYPNVGKSTLISKISGAKPKIANYHFTTLTPVLGVVKVDEGQSFVMADIPGLIEGASEGVGLGHEFLRHIERCRLIVHVIDSSAVEGRNPIDDFETINKELKNFNEELSKRPQIVAGNKCDIALPEQISTLREYVNLKGHKFVTISAATGEGVKDLIYSIWESLKTLPPIRQYEPDQVKVFSEEKDKNIFNIKRENNSYIIEADWLKNVLNKVNMDDYESLQYFQRVLINTGIIDRLEKMGINEGDTVKLFDFEFEYVR